MWGMGYGAYVPVTGVIPLKVVAGRGVGARDIPGKPRKHSNIALLTA